MGIVVLHIGTKPFCWFLCLGRTTWRNPVFVADLRFVRSTIVRACGGVSAIMLICALIPLPEMQRDVAETTVRMVQPNAPQEQKWDPFYAPIFGPHD